MTVSVEDLKKLTDNHRIVYRRETAPDFLETGLYYDLNGALLTYAGDVVLFPSGELEYMFQDHLFEVKEIISPKPELVPYEGMLLSFANQDYAAYLYNYGGWVRAISGGFIPQTSVEGLFETGVLVEFIPEPFTKKES